MKEETNSIDFSSLNCKNCSKGMLTFRGIMISLLGISFIMNPILSTTFFMILIGAFLIVNGISTIIAGIKAISKAFKSLFLIYGIIVLVLGILLICNPLEMNILFMSLIACWILIDGIYSVISVFRQNNHHKISSFWSGGLSIIIAIMLITSPLIGIYTLNWLLGVVILTYGLIVLGSSFKK